MGKIETERIEIVRRISNQEVSYDVLINDHKKRNISPDEVKEIVNGFLNKSSEKSEEIKISGTDTDED